MPTAITPAHALIVVDVQQAFVTGDQATPMRDLVLPAIEVLLAKARAAGVRVLHLQNDGERGTVDEPHQPGWELYFETAPDEPVVRKVHDDGFDGTGLATLLEQVGARRVVVCGLMSEMCVLATARSALARGLEVVLPHDAHATFDIQPAPGASVGVPAAQAARVAEWALGDEVEIVAQATDVEFSAPVGVHWSARLPTKRVAADCLVRDDAGRVLLVRPTYKPTWDLPGGVVEIDESPRAAARREVAEETGLGVEPGALLAVDWIGPTGDVTEVLALLFDGGLRHGECSRRVDEEIAEARFVPTQEATALLDAATWHRLDAALQASASGRCAFLENGSTPT